MLRELRNNPITSTVPIIRVTGLEPDAIADEAKRLGVRSVLRKPYETDELHHVINVALTSKSTRRKLTFVVALARSSASRW